MPQVSYLWEKTLVAVDCLASGPGGFQKRMQDAYISAIARLKPDDAPPELADDLKWILEFFEKNMQSEMAQISDLDRSKVAEKLIHILIETSRMTQK